MTWFLCDSTDQRCHAHKMCGQKDALFDSHCRQTATDEIRITSAHNFSFVPKLLKMGDFQPQISYFYKKIFGSKKTFRRAKM